MKKYEDFKNDIDFTKYKIIVPTNKDKKDLMEAFEHIHYSDIDTDFVTVNQLAHEYLNGDSILVNQKIFNLLETVPVIMHSGSVWSNIIIDFLLL